MNIYLSTCLNACTYVMQYYESFCEGAFLFISMELVEGVSLLDHINTLSGKSKHMAEQDVWQVWKECVCVGGGKA